MYRPEDLECGRQIYHSELELIGSDDRHVIDVASLNGVVEVDDWDEKNELPKGRFWRQTYSTKTKILSVGICSRV